MKKFLKSLINYDYWTSYKNERNLKDALKIFFDEESDSLQKLFLKNFTYPQDMTSDPVRYNEDTGEVYYTINFNSKELFYNEPTLQAAFAQSLSILQVQLPLGVTEYLVPEIQGRIEGSYSILITLTPQYEYIKPWNVFNALLKPIGIGLVLISIVTALIAYV